MAEKLTPEKIEEIAKNYEKITQGKLPIIKGDKEEVTAKIDPKILQAKKDRRKTIPVGRLDTRRDFTDVRDVVRAYRSIITNGVSGESYNVCSGEDRSIGELAKAIMAASECTIGLEPDASLQRPSDIPVLRGDNTKIKSHTGWEPIVEFERTIKDIIESTQSLIDLDS